MRIQHVGLVVLDVERSRQFYADALGLEEVPRPSNFAFDGAWFRFGGTEIHLLSDAHATGGAGQPDPGAGATRGMTHHLAFEVDDVSAACERLADNGVPLEGGPMPRGDGYVQVFFRDPDGYVLEFFQWTGEDQSDAPARAPVR
jgi:catechol 2,3-dioxygenase-like lactoylglutathione lyase family enzyme